MQSLDLTENTCPEKTEHHHVPSLAFLKPATEEEVHRTITKSFANSCGLDPVPTTIIKQHTSILVPVITKIVNKSMSSGIFPIQCKQAHVFPRIKNPSLDNNTLEKYQPVSNHPFLSKIIEKMVNSWLQEHLEENGLHDMMQSAYCSAHSTETALVRITNDILCALDKKNRQFFWYY